MKKQIAGLQRRLAGLNVSAADTSTGPRSVASKSKRRRARRVRGSRSGVSGAAYAAPRIQSPNPRGNAPGASADGSIRIRRKEFLAEIKGQTGGVNGYKLLTPGSFAWLANLAKAFDRFMVHSMSIHWKAAVGTNRDGLVSYGIDWDSSKAERMTRQMVLALTPVNDHPVWQSASMPLPKGKLMSRKEYVIRKDGGADSKAGDFDCMPGYLLYSMTGIEGLVYGEFWVDYDLTLFGTTI